MLAAQVLLHLLSSPFCCLLSVPCPSFLYLTVMSIPAGGSNQSKSCSLPKTIAPRGNLTNGSISDLRPQVPSACYRKGKCRKQVQTTSILQQVCNTVESPMIYRSEGEGRRYVAQTFVHEFDLTIDQVKLIREVPSPCTLPLANGEHCMTPSCWGSPPPPCLLAPCDGKSPARPLQTPSTRTTPPTTSPFPFYAGAGSTGGPAQPLHLSSPHPPASLSSNIS